MKRRRECLWKNKSKKLQNTIEKRRAKRNKAKNKNKKDEVFDGKKVNIIEKQG